MQPATARSPKASQPVQVHAVDIHAGLYHALSSDGQTWYQCNLVTVTCTCPSGMHSFQGVKVQGGVCRHIVAARVVARGLASMRPQDRPLALRLTNIRVHVDKVDITGLSAPLQRPAPITKELVWERRPAGAAGLAEAFGEVA